MNKKSITALALTAAIVSSIAMTGCESTVKFDLPTYVDDKEITLGIWNGSHHDLSDFELQNLQDAGINLLIGQYVRKTPLVDFIDRCAEFGLDIIPDQRPWDGTVPEFIDRENFLGFCVYDEPFVGNFETLKRMREEYSQKMGDKMFFVNLLPSGGAETDFESYLSMYVRDVGVPVCSYDNYSLILDADTGEVTIRENYLYDFSIASKVAEENNVPFWYTFLTAGHLKYTDPTVTELEWQMYLGMTYGATALVNYIYSSHDPDYVYPIVDMSGNPTEKYYRVKEANETIRSWDHIYMSFDWLGTSNVEGTNGATGLLDWTVYQQEINHYGTIASATATEDVVVGHFKDGENNAGFMVTNVTNPVENLSSEVSMKLSSEYKGAIVIHEGEERIVTLSNGKLDIEIPAGSAMFVIPLKAAK